MANLSSNKLLDITCWLTAITTWLIVQQHLNLHLIKEANQAEQALGNS